MKAIANGQLDGFPPKDVLRTVYVAHDLDASESQVSCPRAPWCHQHGGSPCCHPDFCAAPQAISCPSLTFVHQPRLTSLLFPPSCP